MYNKLNNKQLSQGDFAAPPPLYFFVFLGKVILLPRKNTLAKMLRCILIFVGKKNLVVAQNKLHC